MMQDMKPTAKEAESQKGSRPTRKKLRLDWAGALKDMRDQYTSVELRHKILDYWVEAALDGCPSAQAIRRELEAVGRAGRKRLGDRAPGFTGKSRR